MARAIDANELYRIEKLLDTDIVRQDKVALNLLEQVLYDIQHIPTLTPPNELEHAGLYGKYTVRKNEDGALVTDCFVLRPTKDPAAVAALRAYADSTDNAELAADIISWVGAEPNEPLTLDELREMDGEPVWVTPLGFWALVIAKPGERVKLICNDGEIVYADKEIELVGPVYRRPPEVEED